MKTSDKTPGAHDDGTGNNRTNRTMNNLDRIQFLYKKIWLWYALHLGNMSQSMFYKTLVHPYLRNLN